MGNVGGNPGAALQCSGETPAHWYHFQIVLRENKPTWASDTSESPVGHTNHFHLFRLFFGDDRNYKTLSKLES